MVDFSSKAFLSKFSFQMPQDQEVDFDKEQTTDTSRGNSLHYRFRGMCSMYLN